MCLRLPIPCIFQVSIPTRISTDPGHSTRIDQVLLLLLPNVMEHRSLLVVYVFNFYQTLRVVPHGTKGTGPRFITRPVYLRSQFRNNTNTVLLQFYQYIYYEFITGSLCTVCSFAHHWVLLTSGRGWADSKAVHGMECSRARSLYWRSLSVGAAA